MQPLARMSVIEWPTLGLILLCYAGWGGLLAAAHVLPLMLVVAGQAILIALHSSLQHEALHGHPTGSRRLNEALVGLPLGLAFPYRRFRAMHMRHHLTPELTDPYDDPESFYLALRPWQALPRPVRALLTFNNTLFGRLLVGPALAVVGFLLHDIRAARHGGEPGMAVAWALHLAGAAIVVALVAASGEPILAYLAAAYGGLAILGLRTFAEHEAHADAAGRTAIVEASPLFALLFLNNNLHAVHHRYPKLAWYRLPAAFRAEADRFLDGRARRYGGYGEIARRFLFRSRDEVPHPLRHRSAG